MLYFFHCKCVYLTVIYSSIKKLIMIISLSKCIVYYVVSIKCPYTRTHIVYTAVCVSLVHKYMAVYN